MNKRAGVQVYTCTLVQVYTYTCDQVTRCTCVQLYRCTSTDLMTAQSQTVLPAHRDGDGRPGGVRLPVNPGARHLQEIRGVNQEISRLGTYEQTYELTYMKCPQESLQKL
jgi:hypothetical protein